MVDQVRERLAADGDLQVRAMGEVRGTQPARFMHLGEEHLLGRPVQSPPLLDPPLERPQLSIVEAPAILALQPGEERLGFQAGVERQLLLDPLPDVGKGIGLGPPGVFHSHLTGQLAELPVLAGGFVVDARPSGRLALGQVHQVKTAQTLDVQVSDHPKPP